MTRTGWWLLVAGSLLVPAAAWAQAAAIRGSSRFQFDLCSGSGNDPGRNFLSIGGGTPRFTMIDYRAGQDPEEKQTTGDVEFDDVEIVCPLVPGESGNVEDIACIVDAWAAGDGTPWSSTLTLEDRSGNGLRTVHYRDNFLAELRFPAVDRASRSVLELRLTMKPSRVQLQALGVGGGGLVDKKPGAAVAPNFNPVAASNRSFTFELDGEDLGATEIRPGAFKCELMRDEDAQPTEPQFTVTRCSFEEWTLERFYVPNDTTWAELAADFAAAAVQGGTLPPRLFLPARLIYRDRRRRPVATLNMTVLVTGHEPARVDVERRRQVGRERLMLTVCELSVE